MCVLFLQSFCLWHHWWCHQRGLHMQNWKTCCWSIFFIQISLMTFKYWMSLNGLQNCYDIISICLQFSSSLWLWDGMLYTFQDHIGAILCWKIKYFTLHFGQRKERPNCKKWKCQVVFFLKSYHLDWIMLADKARCQMFSLLLLLYLLPQSKMFRGIICTISV